MVERFLISQQGKRVATNLEDRMRWKGLRMRMFLLNTFKVFWRAVVQFCFRKASFGASMFLLGWLFCLESFME